MKRWLGGLVAGTLTLGACILSLQHITRIFLKAETYNISFDNLLSVTAQHSIAHFVAQHFNKIQHTALLHAIKHNFPCIQSIAAEHKRPGLLHFSVTAPKPWFAFNDHFIMSKTGTVIQRVHYGRHHIQKIPHIHVPKYFQETSHVPADFVTHMQHVDTALFTTFNMMWHTAHALILTDIEDPWFSIVCSHAHLPNKTELTQCMTIKEQIKKKLPVTHTTGYTMRTYRADIRFAHQIILTSSQQKTDTKNSHALSACAHATPHETVCNSYRKEHIHV